MSHVYFSREHTCVLNWKQVPNVLGEVVIPKTRSEHCHSTSAVQWVWHCAEVVTISAFVRAFPEKESGKAPAHLHRPAGLSAHRPRWAPGN